MNNEIKQILYSLENQCETSCAINSYFKVEYIRELLDYITKLQQEKNIYKEQLRITHKDLQQYISRCEKASEYIDKQKKKMYKSRNKISMFILMKLENILQNGSDI